MHICIHVCVDILVYGDLRLIVCICIHVCVEMLVYGDLKLT